MSRKPTCANCGIEIRWRPTIIDSLPYCCLGCSRGGPCECDYSRLPKTDDHTAIVPLTTVVVQVSFPAHEPPSNGKSEQTKKKG